MARRWWVRGVVWSGVGLASLIGVLLFVLVLVTQSAFGRERVRQIAERVAARYLLGSLHVGALRFGPGCSLAIDSAALRDPDDSLLVALGPTRATCEFGALVRGRLIVTSLDVARPNVVVRQSASGVWNWSRAIRPDTSPPKPPEPSTGPPRVVVVGPLRLSGGALLLEVPWGPPDSLRGSARDRVIDSALAARAPFIRRSGNALVRRREYSGIAIDAPLVRTQVGDTTVIAVLNGLAGVSADPAITVRRIAGRFALMGSSLDVDLPSVVFNATSTRVDGRLDWGGDGAPAVRAAIAADTIAFADLALFVPNVPRSGGGRVHLAIEGAGGSAPIAYRVTPPTFIPRDPSCAAGRRWSTPARRAWPSTTWRSTSLRSTPTSFASSSPRVSPPGCAARSRREWSRAARRRAARFALTRSTPGTPTRPCREARVG